MSRSENDMTIALESWNPKRPGATDQIAVMSVDGFSFPVVTRACDSHSGLSAIAGALTAFQCEVPERTHVVDLKPGWTVRTTARAPTRLR